MGDNTKMESDLSFVYMTCLLNVLFNLMKYHKISQRVSKLWPAQDLTTMEITPELSQLEMLFLYVTHLQCPLQFDQVS